MAMAHADNTRGRSWRTVLTGIALLTSACVGVPSGRADGGDTNVAQLHTVIRSGSAACLRSLLGNGADPDVPDSATHRTPLETAILAGRSGQVSILLAAGANPDRTNSAGNTALHVAAQTNQPWIALALLNAGARADLRNAQGETFLTYLGLMRDDLLSEDARRGKEAVIDWLAQHDHQAELCC